MMLCSLRAASMMLLLVAVAAEDETQPMEEAPTEDAPAASANAGLPAWLVTALAGVVASLIAWLHYTRRWPFRDASIASEADEGWLSFGLGVELPATEISAYNEAAELVVDETDTSAKAQRLRKAAEDSLLRRATQSLLASWKATDEINRLYRMRRTNRLSTEEWESAQEEFKQFKEELKSIKEQANWLKPGFPAGWGEGIFVDAHRCVLKIREQLRADGVAEDEMPPAGKLRFAMGARVLANMGKGQNGQVRWERGTVLSAHSLPYDLVLDRGQRVSAPQDHDGIVRAAGEDEQEVVPLEGEPPDRTAQRRDTLANMQLWRPYRLRLGERVLANCGSEGWRRGVVVGRHITEEGAQGPSLKGAYVIGLEGEKRSVLAKMDSERMVRRWSPEEEAKTKAETRAIRAAQASGPAAAEAVGAVLADQATSAGGAGSEPTAPAAVESDAEPDAAPAPEEVD